MRDLTEIRLERPNSQPPKGQPVSLGLISVVIPCYNQGQFLSDAIMSVLGQTWRKIELIVVDDGSTDNTRFIVQQFPAARYIRQANQGLAAARNAGLALSTGQFIVFLDADDKLLPSALEHGGKYLLAHPDDAFVHGDFRRIAEDGSPVGTVQKPATGRSGYIGLLQNNYIAVQGAVLYRKDILESIGGFDRSLPACEDYELYLRIARVHQFGYHRHLIAEVRQHSHNMSHDAARMLQTSLRVLRSQKPFLAGNEELERAFRAGHAFWRNCYGEKLVMSVARRLRRSKLKKNTLSDMIILFHYYPGASLSLLRLVRARIADKMKGATGKSAFGRWIRNRLSLVPVGSVRFGNLRRISPVSRDFGFERGMPVDRYYIEGFLARHSEDIRGRVLEIADHSYTLKFGGNRVRQSDVLNLVEKPGASIVADLTGADHIPSDTFDCIILTQTLQLLYDLRSALRTIHRILKPGGVVLVTVPGISQICVDPQRNWSDFWRFTDNSLTRLLEEVFLPMLIRVDVYGNVLSATAFLQGLVVADLKKSELDHRDSEYQVIIAARAEKEIP